ncbi:hypothetical protein [Croceimicrobium hydrocarbonivorans]|uniref:Lipoprotein n=1 Tax=Croceimicrobium hydrocarbonivorans TaxID=2761580 RepID=A0A7H0VIC0_9FLAO|nr:hypothetical protein [Croceimicrobium hydrocarbonivorans]QNR25468.1 hypothetical protein H4K34_06405 [Croceimicrobium hydrocarbonivorans]
MKTSFASVLLVFLISACSSKQAETSASQEVEMTFTKDGQQITKTVEIDTATFNLLEALMEGRKPEDLIKEENDSIFSEDGRLYYVVLGNDAYGAVIKKFIYNEKGQLVRLVGYNKEGSIAPFFEYVAIHEQDYDTEGRLIEERFFDANGAFVGPGSVPPILQLKYDERGNKKEIIYLDANRKMYEGLTRILFEYNEENKLIRKLSYNAKGEIVGEETYQ